MKQEKTLTIHHINGESIDVDLDSLECDFDINMINPYDFERTFHIYKLNYINGEPVEMEAINKLEYLVYDDDNLMYRYDTDDILDSFVEIFVD